jgi:hypothetical protein
MDGVQAERLRGTFDAILFNGSPEDLRAFLAPLDEPTRAYLRESRSPELRYSMSPLEYCIDNLLADHAAVLFEDGVSAAASSIQSIFSNAVRKAVSHRFTRLLEVVVAAAQSQSSLAEVMRSQFRHDNPRSINSVVLADFAPTLAILLDAGLGNDGTFSRSDLVCLAATVGALACLQLLHERCSRDEWKHLLTPVPGMISESPLACAFEDRKHDTVEYLISFHSPGGADGPDLLPQEAVNSALAILAEHAPDQALPLQARLDAARTAYDSWDARTQIETVLVFDRFLTLPDLTPLDEAARTGSSRAMAALFQFGLLPSQSAFCSVATEATAEALLDALAAAEANESQGEAADAATRRQRTATHILRTLSVSLITGAAKYVLLKAAAPGIQAGAVADWLRHHTMSEQQARGMRLARATIESADATEATATALKTLVADESWDLLSSWVRPAQVSRAQLLVDVGADVFVTRNGRSLLEVRFQSRPPSAPKVAPPPIADPTVFAATASGTFASADAARAHAAAAAAEEERLFAAVQEDPDVIRRIQDGSFDWNQWTHSMNSVLGARWVWQCMCERDPERARAYLDPSTSGLNLGAPLSEAIINRDVRRVRFFTSLGACMGPFDVVCLAESCLDGSGEFSWALLDALPGDVTERASILKYAGGGHTAVAGVALAVLDGHRFSPALAEALLAAGATVPRTLLFALCDPSAQDRPVTSLPGELARALRWTLEHFQRTHSSCVF